MTKLLIVDVHAEMYRDRLQAEFPALQFVLFHSAAEVTGNLSNIDVMIMFGIEVRDSMLSGAPQSEMDSIIGDRHRSFPALPLAQARRRDHHRPRYPRPADARQVVYMMMAISRDANRQADDMRHRIWQRRLWSTLHGKTAVVVGTGIVGAAIAELLKALGMHVIGVTRTPRQAAEFCEMLPVEHLLEAAAKADYLINVLPATPYNFELFDAAVFAAMKPTAYYISAGRGQTVDEAALPPPLCERRIAGAALEVFQTEPLPADSPFWSLPNVFITPHVGGDIVEYEDFIMPLIIDNMRLFLAGRQSEMRNIAR